MVQALPENESAGGCVNHVVTAVIQRAKHLAGTLAGVVVDHRPGMGALAVLGSTGRLDHDGLFQRVAVKVGAGGEELRGT